MTLDICMVTFASERFEQAALASLGRATDVPYRLTVIDNNRSNRPLTLVWNDFARASQARFVCLINPDVVFASRWASRLLAAFRVPRVVIAAPCTPTTAASPRQRIRTPLGLDRLDDIAADQPALVIDDPYAVGYCYCVDRAWFVASGGFDPAFPFYGQETDLNFRAFAQGKRAVCVRDSVVYHYGGGSGDDGAAPKLNAELEHTFRCLRARWPLWRMQR